MKIAFIADQFLPGIDGIVISMLNLADGLEELGHEVYFVVPRYPGYKPERERVITIPSLPMPLLGNIRIMQPTPWHRWRLRQMKFDVIHSHNQFAAGRLATRVSRKGAIPHVTTIHTHLAEIISYYPNLAKTIRPLVQANMKILFPNADLSRYQSFPTVTGKAPKTTDLAWRYIGLYSDETDLVSVPSEHMQQKLINLGVSSPVRVLPNGVKLAEFSVRKPRKDGIIELVSVGRLSPEKRQDVLIKAIAKLPKNHFRLTLIGDGPSRRRFQLLARRMRVHEQVKFTKALTPEQVKQHLGQADIGLLVSHGFDTQGLAMVEYLASGLPVIYCDSDLKSVVDGKSALLTKPDADSIAAGISKLADFKLRQKMHDAALKRSRDYDHIAVARQAEHIYQELIA